MQKFRYISEYDLTDMNMLEQLLTAIPHNTWFVVSSILISLLLGISVFMFVTNGLIFKRIKSGTVYEIAIALLFMAVVMIGVQSYIIVKNVHYIGHFEAEGKVVGFADNNAVDERRVLIKLDNEKQLIEANVPDNQKLEKDDEVIAKTKTRDYDERPPKEVTHFNLTLKGIDVSAFKR